MKNLVQQSTLTGTVEHKIIVQKWEESERGWGTRPDGFTMHLTDADREAFIQAYWDRMPDEVPDVYSRPDGTPYEAFVDTATYEAIKESENGVWSDDNNYPGTGGPDGWKNPLNRNRL